MDPDLALELNGSQDEDEALRRAIALSMGDPEPQSSAPGTNRKQDQVHIDLTDSPPSEPTTPAKTTRDGDSPATPLANVHSLSGLNRKQMEEERLARLKKRKAANSMDEPGDSSRPPVKRPAVGGIVPPYLAQAIKDYGATQKEKEVENSISSTTQPRLRFAKGAVKRTWVKGQPRTADDITIEEVLQKDQLELAVLSSYQWDEKWLFSKLDTRKTKILLIAFAPDEAERTAMRANVPENIVRFCFPSMIGFGAMHSKLQLLKFPDYLRIVVPTGNLVRYDWGETGVMENMLFLIDLPRLKDTSQAQERQLTPFGEELCYFLLAQGVDESLVKSLKNYDFSETSRYAFVHSIAGSHLNDDWKRTGYCGLGRAVEMLGLSTSNDVELDFACSSVGSLNDDLMLALYYACQGDSGMREYDARVNRPRKTKTAASTMESATKTAPWTNHFRIYFPSKATVLSSRGGSDAAGTITFQDKWWHAASFPRNAFRDLKNVKRGILSHSKTLFVRKEASESSQTLGWMYLGSANMSESAWGRLVKDKASTKPKLTCRNWECGVLIPATSSSIEARQVSEEGVHMLDVFATAAVPMEVPGARYGSTDQPWFYHQA